MQIFSRFKLPPQVTYSDDQPSMTQQHFADECNINNILAKFIQTGILDNIGPGVYADLTSVGDYRTSLEVISQAEAVFNDLPSHIRKEFDNDPAKYFDFVHDEKNLQRGIELGLFQPQTIPNSQDPLQKEGTPNNA